MSFEGVHPMLDPDKHGTAIRRFGEWAVTTNGLAKADGSFHIPVPRLWDLWNDGMKDKWGWPLLAVKQGAVGAEDRNDFNDAFFFALEQYKAFRPPYVGKASTHATVAAQEALLPPGGKD
jgi:hypothetical protein